MDFAGGICFVLLSEPSEGEGGRGGDRGRGRLRTIGGRGGAEG